MNKYRHVDTQSLAGVKTAERLHVNGWKTIRVGLTYTLFEKSTPKKSTPKKNENGGRGGN